MLRVRMGEGEVLVLVAIGVFWLARGWLAGAGEGLGDFVIVRGDLTGTGGGGESWPSGPRRSGRCYPSI